MSKQLEADMAQFKTFIETRKTETGGWRGEVHDAQVQRPTAATAADQQVAEKSHFPTSSDMSGSDAGDSNANPDAAQPPSPSIVADAGGQVNKTMQSASALSQPPADTDEQDQFLVAEEQAFDQQSDQMRQMGQMPQALDVPDADPAKAMEQAMQAKQSEDVEKLRQALDTSLPPPI